MVVNTVKYQTAINKLHYIQTLHIFPSVKTIRKEQAPAGDIYPDCISKECWHSYRDASQHPCHVTQNPVLTAVCVSASKTPTEINQFSRKCHSASLIRLFVLGNAIVLPFHLISCNRFKIPHSSLTGMFHHLSFSFVLRHGHIDWMTDLPSRLNGLRFCYLKQSQRDMYHLDCITQNKWHLK